MTTEQHDEHKYLETLQWANQLFGFWVLFLAAVVLHEAGWRTVEKRRRDPNALSWLMIALIYGAGLLTLSVACWSFWAASL